MKNRLDRFFQPGITLRWKGFHGKQSDHWYPDTIKDRELLKQFMQDAGLNPYNGIRVTDDEYSVLLPVAGEKGYSITTIGDPNEPNYQI